jgi:rifampicin phosphotransferase
MTVVRGIDELRRGDVAVAGGKGANLGELVAAGLPVPPGFVVTTDAYRRFVDESGIGGAVGALAAEGSEESSAQIRALFRGSPVPADIADEILKAWDGRPSAVRSSATAEDLEGASFAGQQDTYLDIRDADALLDAVRDCWSSLWTARAIAYRGRAGIDQATVALAVVVQRMVDADAAGVLFTANPATGARDETVISAAWGLGESVVGGSVTTDDLVVTRDGRVTSRTTADKAVMTVATGGGTAERPVPDDRRRAPVLDDAAAAELAALGVRAQEHFGAPQDIEWVRAGGTFALVQSRPVTALPEPAGPVPDTWPCDPDAWYFRASIVEQLPDPLSPLFAALIDPAVTRSLRTLFNEFLSREIIREDELGLPTVNGYAYYRYGKAAMGRMMLRLPWALRLMTSQQLGVAYWRDTAHPRYVTAVAEAERRDWAALPDSELLDAVAALLEAGASYYTSVQTVIPIAATSEILFTQFYERAVRRAGDPPATTFLLGFDSAPIRGEKSLHAIATTTAEGSPEEDALLAEHLARYGHTVYDLDFRNPVPADDPAPLRATIAYFRRGEGTDPHVRQATSVTRRDQATGAVTSRLDPARRATFTRLLRWAQDAGPVREDALADVGLAWPLMRRMLAELGRRRVADGSLRAADDVFWLTPDEAVGRVPVAAGAVSERQSTWRGQKRATPPQALPEHTWLDRLEAVMPAASLAQTGPVVRGTGASAGQVTGVARVLAGPADFGRMRGGDVLVASITTPAWTPLFAMAGAVVTDIGGPLSHSSIVAREYGIPAVLGTGVATRRIADGARVLVDGDAGTITLLDDAGGAEPEPERPTRGRRYALAAAGAGVAALLWRRLRRPASRTPSAG